MYDTQTYDAKGPPRLWDIWYLSQNMMTYYQTTGGPKGVANGSRLLHKYKYYHTLIYYRGTLCFFFF